MDAIKGMRTIRYTITHITADIALEIGVITVVKPR